MKAADDKVNDLKERLGEATDRLTRLESEKRATVEHVKDTREEKNSSNLGLIAAAFGVGGIGTSAGLLD